MMPVRVRRSDCIAPVAAEAKPAPGLAGPPSGLIIYQGAFHSAFDP